MIFLSFLAGCFKRKGVNQEQDPPARVFPFRNRKPPAGHTSSHSGERNSDNSSKNEDNTAGPQLVDPVVAVHANRLANVIITATDMQPVRRTWNEVCHNTSSTYKHPHTGEDQTQALAAEVLERITRTIAYLGANEKLDEENARLLHSTEEIALDIFGLSEDDDNSSDNGKQERLRNAMAFVVAGTLMTMVAPWVLRYIGFAANGPSPGKGIKTEEVDPRIQTANQ